jgi:hypothetical protein
MTVTSNSDVDTGDDTTLSSRPQRGRFNPGRSAVLATDRASTRDLNLQNVATPAASPIVFDTVHGKPNVETKDLPALDAAFAAFNLYALIRMAS